MFDDADKQQLASEIADRYGEVGLPRFYVVVLFAETVPTDFFVGGLPASRTVRIAIDHIARRNPDSASRQRTAAWVSAMLAPYVQRSEGLHWEFHIDETSSELWMIDGLVPPAAGSDAENRWARDNAATPY